MKWSPKQASFISHSTAFVNISDGAVRSGKTHSALARFGEMCLKGPRGDFAVVGKTERTVKRNVVYPLEELLPGMVRYVQGAGELYVFGRRCWVIGANDVAAESKVRGMTLAGSYLNEVTLYPENIWQTLIDRHSVNDAQILGDCNPDSPYHWLNRDYLSADKPKDFFKRWRFKLEDNPVLSETYKRNLRLAHPPGTLWHRRMTLGEWVAAEGAVYPMLDVTPGGPHVFRDLPEVYERVVVGVDYATSTTTVFLAAGLYRGVWHVFSEWRHDAIRANRQLSDSEQSRAFTRWLDGLGLRLGPLTSIEVDPSAQSFKKQLKDDGVGNVRDADNSVVDGIRTVTTALSGRTLRIHESCEGLLREMSTYSWDARAQARGEDKPVKKDDHGPDCLRYLCARAIGRPLVLASSSRRVASDLSAQGDSSSDGFGDF